MIYIYGLECPVAGVVRYVGKSISPKKRLRSHLLAAARNEYDHHTARWLRHLMCLGLEPQLVILEIVPDGESWQRAERRHIARLSEHGMLTNSTAGGEGLDYIHQEDLDRYRANLSAAMKALWSKPERRAEARNRSLSAWSNPQMKRQRVDALRAAASRPEVKAKVLEVLKRIAIDPDIQKRKSAASGDFWNSDKGEQARQALYTETDFLAEQSARLKMRWQDDAQRQKMKSARWTPEKRLEQAARLAERREKMLVSMTPGVRAKQAQSLRDTWARRKAQTV